VKSTGESPPPGQVAAPNEAPRRGNLSILETASRLTAVSIAVIYAAGFLVVTLHDSQFGIVPFSPFRPRIFSAGALFGLLLAVPVLSVSRGFEFLGLRNRAALSIRVRPENVKYLRLSAEFELYLVCFALCFPSLVLFPPGYLEIKPWGFTLVIAVVALDAFVYAAQQKRFDWHPLTVTIMSFLSAAALVVVTYLFWSRSYFWLSIWYYSVAIVTVYLQGVFEKPERIKSFQWEKAVLSCLAVVLAFATGIYGRISPSFGGGSPMPAVLHLVTAAPISSSTSVSVLVVDENDYGYYVLRPGEDGKAYFLRRDSVSSIEFERNK